MKHQLLLTVLLSALLIVAPDVLLFVKYVLPLQVIVVSVLWFVPTVAMVASLIWPLPTGAACAPKPATRAQSGW